MSWRLASRLSVVTLALLVILVIALFSLHSSSDNNVGASGEAEQTSNTSGLQGTDLGSVVAPDFRLEDQFGKQVSLSQFKGKPVVLTFLYTHCPDVCPLIADQLHTTASGLGKNAGHVVFLAVSMDPKGDTQAAVLRFSKVHKMTNYWHYLIGTRDELAPVWSAYSVDAQAATAAGVVNHSTALYVIDKEGRERVLLDNNFTSQQLEDDLLILLNE
jgi:protein SCO1/2